MVDFCLTFEQSRSSLKRLDPTFRDNSYINALNRALRTELELCDLFLNWSRQNPKMHMFATTHSEDHHKISRELVRLIVANRGIPEDADRSFFGAARIVNYVGPYVSTQLRDRFYFRTVSKREMSVEKLMRQIEVLAPYREKPIVREIANQIKKAAIKRSQLSMN